MNNETWEYGREGGENGGRRIVANRQSHDAQRTELKQVSKRVQPTQSTGIVVKTIDRFFSCSLYSSLVSEGGGLEKRGTTVSNVDKSTIKNYQAVRTISG